MALAVPVVRTSLLGEKCSSLVLTLWRAKPPSGMDFAKMMEQMKAAGVGGPEGAEGEGEADSSDDEGVSPAPSHHPPVAMQAPPR